MLQTTLSLTLTTPPTRSSTCAEILFLEFSRKVPDLNKFSANVKHSSQNLCGFSPETLYQMMLLWRQLWGDSLLERKDMKNLFFRVMRKNNLPWEKLVRTKQTGCEALP